MTKWALKNTDVTDRRGECACARARDEAHPSFLHVLRGSVFIQLCDSGDASRFPTRLQRYVVAWAQQAELLFIIHWWLFIAEHQHLRCSVCPVFACRASLAALFSQELNCVCGGKQWRARRTGTGWVFHQNTPSVFPSHHFVRFESASSLFRCQCSNYLCCE